MRSIFLLVLLGFVGTVSAQSPDEEQIKALKKAVGEGFAVYETDHFYIAHNTTGSVLEDFSDRVETTYCSIERYCTARKLPFKTLPRKLEVIYFDTYEQFAEFSNLDPELKNAAGYYSHNTNRSVFYNLRNSPQHRYYENELNDLKDIHRLSRDGDPRKEYYADLIKKITGELANFVRQSNQEVLQHETAHQVLFNLEVHNTTGKNPTWVVEGMACVFETPPSRTGAGRYKTNQGRLAEFREALTVKKLPSINNFPVALEEGKLLPVRSLITQKGPLVKDGKLESSYYAQAWSLVWFMQKSRNKQFAAYLHEVAKQDRSKEISAEEEVALFEKHFGSLEKVEKRWIQYILKLPVKPYENPRHGRKG